MILLILCSDNLTDTFQLLLLLVMMMIQLRFFCSILFFGLADKQWKFESLLSISHFPTIPSLGYKNDSPHNVKGLPKAFEYLKQSLCYQLKLLSLS